MATKKEYTVNVGNIGNIEFDTLAEAKAAYKDYVNQSKSDSGRASGEDVALFIDGEIEDEYFVTMNEDDEFAKGGKVKKSFGKAGRARDMKMQSQEPHELRYKRKTNPMKYAKGGTVIKKGNRVRVINTQYDGKQGLVVSNDLVNGDYQVQIDGTVKGFPFDNLMLLSRSTFAKGGEVGNKIVKEWDSKDTYGNPVHHILIKTEQGEEREFTVEKFKGEWQAFTDEGMPSQSGSKNKQEAIDGVYKRFSISKYAKGGAIKKTIKANVYKWGEYLEDEDFSLDNETWFDYVVLGEELDGFNIRKEDEDKIFIALSNDIDGGDDDDGYSVKYAYAIPKGEVVGYFSKGGGFGKAGHARDMKMQSQEPHELAYKRKTKAMKYKDGGKIKSLKEEINDIEEGLSSPAMPEALKADMKKVLSQLKADLKEQEGLPKAPPVKKEKSKAAPVKKEKKPKFGGDKTCAELKTMYEKRRADAKKSGKKRKTISVSEQIGDSLAKAVGKAIDSIPKADIKASPKKYITALENLETGVTESIKNFRVALGDDYDRKEILEPIEEIIGKFIKNIKEKYSKK